MDTKAAFEKCAASNGYDIAAAGSQYRSYINAETETAWQIWNESWKQSRAAIEIDISPENVEALVTTCQHLIEREGYSEHSANLRLIAKLALPVLTSHGIRIKGKTE